MVNLSGISITLELEYPKQSIWMVHLFLEWK